MDNLSTIVWGRFGSRSVPKDVPIRVEWRTSAPVVNGFPFCLCTKNRLLTLEERIEIRSFCSKKFARKWAISPLDEARLVDYLSFEAADHLSSFMEWAGMLTKGALE